MSLITSSIEPRRRGSFVSANSAVQHIASGLGATHSMVVTLDYNVGRTLRAGLLIASLLAAVLHANILAMFRLIRDMPPKDKVLNIAFAVCAALTFGDHLAYRLSVRKAPKWEKKEMEARVRAACAEVPMLHGKGLDLKELGGGLTNVNYQVSADGVACVVRIFGENTELLGIDRIRETECHRAAAAAGVASQVIAFLPQHRALVTQFIEGKVLTAADAHRPEILRCIAQALRRCHRHPVEAHLGAFSALAVIRQYHQLASDRRARLPAELPECLAILEGIENELKGGPAPCLCHNDLLAENFIDQGGTLRIIDWEYGGLGDPFFDLGNFAVNTGLTEVEERLLLTEYFGAARPEDLRRLRLMRLVSDMREAMWSFLQDTISTLHKDYFGRGREHLARFRTAAAALPSRETRA